MDASVAHMMLATYTRTLEELQSIAVLLQEIRDVQKERLELDKNRAEAATAVAEEPASLDANEVRAMPLTYKTFEVQVIATDTSVCAWACISIQARVWRHHACLSCMVPQMLVPGVAQFMHE